MNLPVCTSDRPRCSRVQRGCDKYNYEHYTPLENFYSSTWCPEQLNEHVSHGHSKREVSHCDFRKLRFELRPTLCAVNTVLTELPAPGYSVQRISSTSSDSQLAQSLSGHNSAERGQKSDFGPRTKSRSQLKAKLAKVALRYLSF